MTKKNYYQIWRTFNEFFLKLDVKPREWEDRIILFIGYLVQNKRQSSTIKSYVSAIKAVLKINGIKFNPDLYLLSSLTKACKLVNDKVHTKLPIHKGVLGLIIAQLPNMFANQPYLLLLYKAMFVTAYYGLLCVGELTAGSHPIKAKDVFIGSNKDKLMMVLRSSKTHDKSMKPQIIKIMGLGEKTLVTLGKNSTNQQHICPFRTIRKYIAVRKSFKTDYECFFVFRD